MSSRPLRPVTFLLLALLPLLMVAGAAAPSAKRNAQQEPPKFTVVIDPGHGGADNGATGNGAREKDINLAVALRLGKLIKANHPDDVKVVYTRSSDKAVGLQSRCDIANRAKGDLFISIHVNSVKADNPGRKSVKGASVYTLGLGRSSENLEVAQRENAVMTLEPDYSTRYSGFDPNSAESYIMFELNQNAHMKESIRFANMVQRRLVSNAGRADKGVRQDIFWVLVHTGMPAVLVELDFICNPTSAAYLTSATGEKQMAGAISDAFDTYLSSRKKAAR